MEVIEPVASKIFAIVLLCYWIKYNKKSAGFSFASFDLLRSSTTLFTQIYVRKTHAST